MDESRPGASGGDLKKIEPGIPSDVLRNLS
jgi:hypothetical protein